MCARGCHATAAAVREQANGGCLLLHWSESPVEGALASFAPSEPAPAHKFTTNGGRSELCREVGGPNVKKFYVGWLSFVKAASSFGGRFQFRSNLSKLPGEATARAS